MLYHMVMLEPANDGAMSQIDAAMAILETLPEAHPGFTAFSHGPNRDFERKSERYPYGFLCTFTDKAALDAYAADPDHQRAGALLVRACKNGAAGIFVVDLES
ncbi:Dabb family protein [Gymnodinialimonas ceratoperidinii]|uniref:Dabb family protein n=1 Tax=Gymnodinialimonas ceratoperidinii TaxID=2856823 RepID=A0A8F6TYJ5_9RHOB|nr:Dabb family protein [Gymnodinialimonas ceratoperidinii]QXT40319.1 Dabb family protein [Gymnodinialimonas ceratoperidinii]